MSHTPTSSFVPDDCCHQPSYRILFLSEYQDEKMLNSYCLNTSIYSRRYTPNHSFAHLLICQINDLQMRPQDISKAMGYPKQNTLQACDRLRHVLCSKTLGLDDSYLDALYDAEGFLITLCDLLHIEPWQYQKAILQIKNDLLSDTLLSDTLS